jgi:hypothetical protein
VLVGALRDRLIADLVSDDDGDNFSCVAGVFGEGPPSHGVMAAGDNPSSEVPLSEEKSAAGFVRAMRGDGAASQFETEVRECALSGFITDFLGAIVGCIEVMFSNSNDVRVDAFHSKAPFVKLAALVQMTLNSIVKANPAAQKSNNPPPVLVPGPCGENSSVCLAI